MINPYQQKLDRAVSKGDIKTVKRMIKKGDGIDMNTLTLAFPIAVKYNHLNIVNILLKNGVNPSMGIYEAIMGNNDKLVTLFINLGADPKPALFWAASRGNIRIFNYLLQFGSVSLTDINDYLGQAALESHPSMVSYLIELGANDFDEAINSVLSSVWEDVSAEDKINSYNNMEILYQLIKAGGFLDLDNVESLTDMELEDIEPWLQEFQQYSFDKEISEQIRYRGLKATDKINAGIVDRKLSKMGLPHNVLEGYFFGS